MFKYGIKFAIEEMIYKIKRLYKWNKLLYNNYDWDAVYLIEVIICKLELMEVAFRDGDLVGSSKHAEEIRETIEIGKLILDSEEYTDEQENIDKFYGNLAKYQILWWD